MAKFASDAVLDALLNDVRTADEMYLNVGQPADRAGAISSSLIDAQTPSYTANADGSPNGREFTVEQASGFQATGSGDADHVSLCTGTALKVVTTTPTKTVSTGNDIVISSWAVSVSDPV
jgi:hypothetical protein